MPASPQSQPALSVGFLTTLGVNVGDEFIREGIRHCLDRSGAAVRPYFVNKHDPDSLSQPRDIEFDRISDKILDVDIFIQSGAPVYWHHGPGRHRSTQAEWHSWVWEERILRSQEGPVFINLGAGSCQPWGGDGSAFVDDRVCADFAVRAGARAALTTVRDPLASQILSRLRVAHECLPCPALLAAGRQQAVPAPAGLIGVNLMGKGGHYDFAHSFDSYSWTQRMHKLLQAFRQMGQVIFICHDMEEQQYAEYLAAAGERIFLSKAYRDYLDLYRSLACIFANRVHAAVTAAGFGIPAIIAGTDTRARIGEWIGLDVLEARTLEPSWVAERMATLLRVRDAESERLLNLREETVSRYVQLLAPILNSIAPRAPKGIDKKDDEAPIVRWLHRSPENSNWPTRIGIEPLWVIGESGFHSPEPYDGSTLRWTNGHASLTIPGELGILSDRIDASLWGVHPPGHGFAILIDGQTIFEGQTGADGAWSGGVAFDPRVVQQIEIKSSTIQPEGDGRTLGVALRQFCLRAAQKGS